MQPDTLIPSDFPIVRSLVKELWIPATPAEFMPAFWRTASEIYAQLHACLPSDMLQDEMTMGYRKTSPTTVNVRVSINSMS